MGFFVLREFAVFCLSGTLMAHSTDNYSQLTTHSISSTTPGSKKGALRFQIIINLYLSVPSVCHKTQVATLPLGKSRI